MDTEDIREALEYGELTSYQADTYLTVLELGVAPAVEIGRNCSVPVSQVYDVLRSLEDRGYIETMDRDKLYAQPSEPSEIVDRLQRRGQSLVDAAEAIEDRYQRPAQMNARLSVTNRAETTINYAMTFAEDAETIVELAVTEDQFERFLPALRQARENGAFVRVSLYDDGAYPDSPLDPTGAVDELRVCPIPGPFLAIVDRRRTCFAPNARSDEDYGVLIHDRILPFVFHWYYLTCLWDLYPTLYVDDNDSLVYVSMEEFVRDFHDLWTDGYELTVRVKGVDIEDDSERVLSGPISDIVYWWTPDSTPPKSLSRLASLIAINVDTGDEVVSVGGWGAVLEDVEMRRIDLIDIGLPDL